MESPAGASGDRSGRKESWGAILRARFVRAVVLCPRTKVCGRTHACERERLSSSAAGRARLRMSIVEESRVVPGEEIRRLDQGAKRSQRKKEQKRERIGRIGIRLIVRRHLGEKGERSYRRTWSDPVCRVLQQISKAQSDDVKFSAEEKKGLGKAKTASWSRASRLRSRGKWISCERSPAYLA